MSARATKLAADRASEVEASEYDTAPLLRAPLMLGLIGLPLSSPKRPACRIVSPETTRGTTRPTPERRSPRRLQSKSKVQIPTDFGELAYSDENRSGRYLSSIPDSSITFLTLEGEPMSQERPTSNPNSKHIGGSTHALPSTLQPAGQAPRFPAEELSTVLPTRNRYWRYPGLTPPPPSVGPPVVTVEAFLGLAQQV
ncbi:hypothetical protein BHE74_00022025 [Ensete ventricosum]|nr:hypothetical protein BHE74_00022025 [Ensete ventricosum]